MEVLTLQAFWNQLCNSFISLQNNLSLKVRIPLLKSILWLSSSIFQLAWVKWWSFFPRKRNSAPKSSMFLMHSGVGVFKVFSTEILFSDHCWANLKLTSGMTSPIMLYKKKLSRAYKANLCEMKTFNYFWKKKHLSQRGGKVVWSCTFFSESWRLSCSVYL